MNFFLVKRILIALNATYLIVSFVLIGLAAYVRLSAYVTSISVVGGIIACGVFLCLLAVLGLVGTIRHSQAVLFFYIILLFSLFLIQFSVACACLALSSSDQRSIVEAAWRESANETKIDMMRALQCCGFRQTDLPPSDPLGNPPCKLALLPCCSTSQGQRAACCQGHVNSSDLISPCPCTTSCWTVVQAKLERGIRVTGTVGVFFSIIERFGNGTHHIWVRGLPFIVTVVMILVVWTSNLCSEARKKFTLTSVEKNPSKIGVIFNLPFVALVLLICSCAFLVYHIVFKLIGVWLALQYRHKRDPSFDPNSVR